MKPQLRITTGIAKNKPLKTPAIENFRAVQEVAKMAIFAILEDKIVDAQCLDLYAGSGNLGIEALSRGAAWCDFVDENPEAINTIQDNLNKTQLWEKAEVIRKDAVKYTANTEKTYDIIFMDPFYDNTAHVFLMTQLEQILDKDGKIIYLYGENAKIDTIIKDTNLEVQTTRKFGKSYFSILEHKKVANS